MRAAHTLVERPGARAAPPTPPLSGREAYRSGTGNARRPPSSDGRFVRHRPRGGRIPRTRRARTHQRGRARRSHRNCEAVNRPALPPAADRKAAPRVGATSPSVQGGPTTKDPRVHGNSGGSEDPARDRQNPVMIIFAPLPDTRFDSGPRERSEMRETSRISVKRRSPTVT